MTENDRVFDAFRNCITEPKCKDCPWTECDKLKNRRVEIPIDLALAVMRMLKAQEPVEPIVETHWETPSVYDNDVKVTENKCGACGEEIDKWDKYCRVCGRAVKWE